MLAPGCLTAELVLGARLLEAYGTQLMGAEVAGDPLPAGRGGSGSVPLDGGDSLTFASEDVVILVKFEVAGGRAAAPKVDFLAAKAPTPGQLLLAGAFLAEWARINIERATLVSLGLQQHAARPSPDRQAKPQSPPILLPGGMRRSD